jgi:hypothetical protein
MYSSRLLLFRHPSFPQALVATISGLMPKSGWLDQI